MVGRMGDLLKVVFLDDVVGATGGSQKFHHVAEFCACCLFGEVATDDVVRSLTGHRKTGVDATDFAFHRGYRLFLERHCVSAPGWTGATLEAVTAILPWAPIEAVIAILPWAPFEAVTAILSWAPFEAVALLLSWASFEAVTAILPGAPFEAVTLILSWAAIEAVALMLSWAAIGAVTAVLGLAA